MILYHTCNHKIETIWDLLARVTTLHDGDAESLDHGQQVRDCPGCGADLLEDDLSMTPVCDYCENSSDGGECSVCCAPLCDDCADWDQATGDPVCPNCLAAESDPVAQSGGLGENQPIPPLRIAQGQSPVF